MAHLTLEESFRKFNAKKWHNQMCWSAIAENSISVITLWNHQILRDKEKRMMFYTCFEDDHVYWQGHAGNTKRKEHILNSQENHKGYFSAIEVFARDSDARPIEIRKQVPMMKLWWKITQYNPETGEFSAECDVSLLREEGELYPSFL